MIAAEIEFFGGRARVMALALATATIACAVVMLAGVPGAPIREAEAHHIAYSSMSGKLTKADTGGSVAGGAVYLYRWNGSSWVNLGKKATSNQYGYYTISNVGSGYQYAVRGYKTYASCYTGMAVYDGYSQTIDLRNPASSRTVANVSLRFQGYLYC